MPVTMNENKQQGSGPSTQARAAGRAFEPQDTKTTALEDRLAKTFTPVPDEALSSLPESITAGERLPQVPEYSGIRLDALPIKGLKTFAYGVAAVVMTMVGWETYSVFTEALSTHWLLAAGFMSLILVVAGLGINLARRYFFGSDIQAAIDIRNHMARFSQGQDFGNTDKLISELKNFYANKPQAIYLKKCLETLPDYNNDRETIAHLERGFIAPLDQEALRRISDISLQTSVVVAASPWAAVDMCLALWRSMKLIDEVAQVYGIRPSLLNRYKLLKRVIHQLVFVGASEIVMDELIEEMGGVTLVAQFSSKIAQGLGAGIYTAKIGLAAMAVSRPIEFGSEKPKLSALVSPLIKNVKRYFKIKPKSP